MTRSLFHYQPLVETHLTGLLAERKVKLARPDAFNDPWDCRVHYKVPSDQPERERLVQWLIEINRKRFPQKPEAERIRNAKAFLADPAKLEAAFVEMEQQMYRALCQQYRVYCLSEHCDSTLMWGHYANSHRGVCLEFDALVAPFTKRDGVTKVEYRTTYPASDIVTAGYAPLVTKSHVWAYEAEWRILAEERGFDQAHGTIKTDNDFLILPPGTLKSIILGCLASEESRQLVARLVRTHAPGVLVRQATLARDSYNLVVTPT